MRLMLQMQIMQKMSKIDNNFEKNKHLKNCNTFYSLFSQDNKINYENF